MSVFSRLKRFAAGLAAAALLFTLALFSLPYFLSEQQIRAEVTRSIQAATGVAPRIEGPARLALLPRPAIRLNEVFLDDGSRVGLAVGSLQASVQFWPLLFGEIRIATLSLDRPRLAIEFSREGKIVGGFPVNRAMPSSEEVPELRIVDGIVLIRVEDRERVEILSNVQASLSWSGASLTATGTFSLRDRPANGSIVIADTAALAKGQRSAMRLRIESEPIRLSYEGGIFYQERLQAEGAISATSPSLRSALALLDVTAPSPGGFGRTSMKANLSLTPIALTLTNLTIELDGNRADGGFTWKRDGERSILQGTLASETADLSVYRGSFSLLGVSGRDWDRRPVELSSLKNLEVDLRFSCGRLMLGKVEIGKAAIALAVRNRQFTASIGEAEFYGGTFRGSAAWNAAEEIPELKLEANLANFDLEKGLGGLSGFRRLEGPGTLSISVSGKGKSIQEIAASLTGQSQLTMKQGALSGINAEAVLRRLERRPLSGTGDLRGGRTPFDGLIAKLVIEDGVGALETLDIESQILRIKLAGETSIARREFDLRGTASLVRGPQKGTPQVSFDLPFLIQGNWDNPYLLPDPEALIRHSGAAAPLLDAVRGRAAREAMRNVIETVTGLRSIGELPANPAFEPPTVVAPISAPAPSAPPAQ